MCLKTAPLIFHLEYYLESKFKADILDFYVTDISQRGTGFQVGRPVEILDQLKKKQVTLIKSPIGYEMAPVGYTGRNSIIPSWLNFSKKPDSPSAETVTRRSRSSDKTDRFPNSL